MIFKLGDPGCSCARARVGISWNQEGCLYCQKGVGRPEPHFAIKPSALVRERLEKHPFGQVRDSTLLWINQRDFDGNLRQLAR
jgi:hypothetical protein